MPGRPISRAVGYSAALKMKAMYEERHPLSGGRVWTMAQIAETFSVSESSCRRAIIGAGAYKGVPEPAPHKTDEELRDEGLALYERLQKDLAHEKAMHPDELVKTLDGGPSAGEALLDKMLATPLSQEELAAKVKLMEALKGEGNAE